MRTGAFPILVRFRQLRNRQSTVIHAIQSHLIALLALLMAAHGLWICNYLSLISDHFPARVMATTMGLTGPVGGRAGILANLGTGPIVDAHGFTPIFIGTAMHYPLALVVLLTIPRHDDFDPYKTCHRVSAKILISS